MEQYNRVQESSSNQVVRGSEDTVQLINYLLRRIEILEVEVRRQVSRIRVLESSIQEVSKYSRL